MPSTSPSPPFAIEELLGHADWLRRLAGHLVRGGEDVEDALQETWAAALRSPPARDREAPPWLAEVLRNFVRRAARSARGRRAREQIFETLTPPPVATPELLLARAQAQRQIVELVLALEEPFRSAVLLRYFEGLSGADIARAQGIPAGTVRWRLKEALDRLRAGLDAQHAGDRRAWALLLSPTRMGSGPAAAPPSRPGAPGSGATGGLTLAMTTTQKKILGALTLLLLAAAGTTGLLLWSGDAPAPAPAPASAEKPPAPARPPAFVPPLPVPAGEVIRDRAVAAGSVEGQVVSALDGQGIAGAELSFSFAESSLPATTDAEGRFRFSPPDPGVYLLARVSAPGYFAFSPEWGDSPISFALRAGERIRGVRLALRSERSCRGVLLDPAGKPVAGAKLRVWTSRRMARPSGFGEATDDQGRFAFPAIEGAMVEVYHQGQLAREQVSFSVVQQCAIRLQLRPVGEVADDSISGQVLGPDGAPLAGVAVDAWTNPVLSPNVRRMFARTETGADGRFQLGPLDPIAYDVSTAIAGREVAERDEVPAGTRDLLLQVAAMGRLRGQVSDAESGAPVVSFSVVLFRKDPRAAHGPWGSFTRYDGQGLFEIESLPVGRYRVMVVSDGKTPSEEQEALVAAEAQAGGAAGPSLRFSLRNGNRLFGVVTDRLSQAPIAGARVSVEGRAGLASELPLRSEILSGADGQFEIRGLPPGHLALLVTAGGHHGRIKAGLEVRAGRDLGPVAVDLTPTRDGEPPRIELVGIGAQVAMRGDAVLLGRLSPDGGAARAGLMTGDAILAMDGIPVKELGGLEGAVQRIRGAEGSVLVFRVRRAADGREQDVRVTRSLVRGP